MKRNLSILLVLSLILCCLFVSNAYADEGYKWKEVLDDHILRENGELWYVYWPGLKEFGQPKSQSMYRIMENVKSTYRYGNSLYIIRDNGELWVWTKNYNKPNTLEKIMDGVKQVSVNDKDTYMVVKENNELWGWGNNKYGQLLDGTTKYSYEPKKVMDNVKCVTTGYNRVFAVKTNGELLAWGFNPSGYLGDGTKDDAFEPRKLLDGVSRVEIFGDVTFAIKENGELWGWGNNYRSQIYSEFVDGHNISERNIIKPMKLLDNVKKVGPYYAIKENGDFYIWEQSIHPRLGLTNVKDVSRSDYRTVIKENGEVYVFVYIDSNPYKKYENISFMLHSRAIDKDGSLVDLSHDKVNVILDSQKYTNASGWALEGLRAADNNGLIDAAKAFPFDAYINRETFAKLSLRLYEKLTNNKEIVLKDNPFKDTDDPNIIKAYSVGIISGVSADKFDPEGFVTREQIASMLKRTLDAANINVRKGSEVKFADMDQVSEWALDAVNNMSSIGVITGSNNYFSPRNKTTVEQACIMVDRLYEKANNN